MLGTLAPAWPEGRVCRDTVGAVGTVRRIVRSDSGFCGSSETIFRNRGRQEAEEERRTILLSLTVGWMFGGAPREGRTVRGRLLSSERNPLANANYAFTPRAHVINFFTLAFREKRERARLGWARCAHSAAPLASTRVSTLRLNDTRC